MTNCAAGQKTILVVDDEKLIRWSLTELLRKEFSVYAEASAEEALKILAFVPVDIVITDLRMPGMNGLEFIDLLRRKYPHVKVFALTAYASGPMSKELMARGAQGVLAKPFDLGQVRDMLALSA